MKRVLHMTPEELFSNTKLPQINLYIQCNSNQISGILIKIDNYNIYVEIKYNDKYWTRYSRRRIKSMVYTNTDKWTDGT